MTTDDSRHGNSAAVSDELLHSVLKQLREVSHRLETLESSIEDRGAPLSTHRSGVHRRTHHSNHAAYQSGWQPRR